MTDIRIRIATAIMQSCHGVYMDDAVAAADAVIRELGLKQYDDFRNVVQHRYLTAWVPKLSDPSATKEP